jgi:hypothetical protein
MFRNRQPALALQPTRWRVMSPSGGIGGVGQVFLRCRSGSRPEMRVCGGSRLCGGEFHSEGSTKDALTNAGIENPRHPMKFLSKLCYATGAAAHNRCQTALSQGVLGEKEMPRACRIMARPRRLSA